MVEAANPGAILLAQLAAALQVKVATDLRASLSPLGKEGVAACDVEPRDLGVFWECCERVLCGLGSTITLPTLRWENLMQVGPILLGEVIWTVLRDQSFEEWESFKAVMEDGYGLTEA